MTEWFEQWFGEEYLQLYPHRDDEDAARVVDLVTRHVPVGGSSLLDLACGTGRHAARFAGCGARVVGLDLSRPLLARARRRPDADYVLVRGDMRALPFGDAAFDAVVNLFTSFGYFADDAEHRRVLREAARVLRPGGAFVLDYLNAPQAVAGLVPHEERTVGRRRVAVDRRISDDGRFVIKQIQPIGEERRFLERVRLYGPGELQDMLGRAGLTSRQVFGDYAGGALAESSPRAIFVAERG